MNQKLLSSLTASLLIATLGVSPSNANPVEPLEQGSEANPKPADSDPAPGESTAPVAAIPDQVAKVDEQSNEVVKIGEQASQKTKPTRDDTIAKVEPHEISGRKSATLYVKNLPVLTFTGSTKATLGGVKVGTQLPQVSITGSSFAQTKSLKPIGTLDRFSLSALLNSSQKLAEPYSDDLNPSVLDSESSSNDPVWKATTIAATLNQLYRNGVDAEKITVTWDSQPSVLGTKGDRLLIKADGLIVATIDSSTAPPGSTRNLEKDALQATNRLRRILGNAAPLSEVTGKPSAWSSRSIAIGPIQIKLNGLASWYGPGFHGNPCANGEPFNQNALTAAHRTLPFGTRVLVTNMDNGQTVVVRINDRGPYSGNRIIDLSTGAARVLGLIQSGVALVKLEVLSPENAIAAGN